MPNFFPQMFPHTPFSSSPVTMIPAKTLVKTLWECKFESWGIFFSPGHSKFPAGISVEFTHDCLPAAGVECCLCHTQADALMNNMPLCTPHCTNKIVKFEQQAHEIDLMSNIHYFLDKQAHTGLCAEEKIDACNTWNQIFKLKLWAATDTQYTPIRTKHAAMSAGGVPLLPGEEEEGTVFYSPSEESFEPRLILFSDDDERHTIEMPPVFNWTPVQQAPTPAPAYTEQQEYFDRLHEHAEELALDSDGNQESSTRSLLPPVPLLSI